METQKARSKLQVLLLNVTLIFFEQFPKKLQTKRRGNLDFLFYFSELRTNFD